MRTLAVVLLLASLTLAGCASQEGGEAPLTATVAGNDPGAPYGVARVPLRFATGDFEGNQTGKADFVIQEQCIMLGGSCSGGEVDFDLTPIVPANAPVELVVKVYGANAALEFTDASAVGTDQEGYGEYDGQASTFAPIVVRGDAGKVTLRVYNPGGFGIPPEANPSATYEAHSVVRAGVLVPGVPAALRLEPGDRVNLTSMLIEDVLLIAPDGTPTRVDAAPFELVANGTAGEYTILLRGGEATAVYGPNVTLAARRLVEVAEDPRAVPASGADWAFSVPGIPVQVGLTLQSGGASPVPFGFGSPGSFTTRFVLQAVSPTGATVLDEDDQGMCQPICGGFRFSYGSAYLDDQLRAGDYAMHVEADGNDLAAFAWATVLV